MWHCIIGFASCWFINVCWRLVIGLKPISYSSFRSTYGNNQWKCTLLIACFYLLWSSFMLVTFHVCVSCQRWWHGYNQQAIRCSIVPQIHSGFLLLFNLVSNWVLGVGRAWIIVGSTFLKLGFESPSSYLGFSVLGWYFLLWVYLRNFTSMLRL